MLICIRNRRHPHPAFRQQAAYLGTQRRHHPLKRHDAALLAVTRLQLRAATAGTSRTTWSAKDSRPNCRMTRGSDGLRKPGSRM